MSEIPPKVRAVLEAHGLVPTESAPGSTPTAQMAADQLGVEVGQIAKSILWKAKNGTFYLVVAAGDRRIDNKLFKAAVGYKARMATAEETEGVTGFRPGAVCPFGLEGTEELTLLVDTSLDRFDIVYPAAGTDSSGVPLTVQQLVEITGAERCSVTR